MTTSNATTIDYNYSVSKESALAVANTIRKQLGVWGLGVVGASQLLYSTSGMGALRFTARLHFQGSSQVRKMGVEVVLNFADLYDIVVTRPNGTSFKWAEDVAADQLVELMYELDSQGISRA